MLQSNDSLLKNVLVNVVFFYFIFRITTAVFKIVKKATGLWWNIPEISIIIADNDEEVKKIFCKLCKVSYVDCVEGKATLDKFTGNIKKVIQNWVSGSEIVKKEYYQVCQQSKLPRHCCKNLTSKS